MKELHFLRRTNSVARLMTLVCGLVLLAMGLSMAVPALILLPHQASVDALLEQKTIPPDQLSSLIDAEKTSLAIHQSAQNWSHLGLALLLEAVSKPDSGPLLAESRDALRKSVELSPANPFVWARLAAADRLLKTDPADILSEWRMAYMTGPNEDSLRSARFRMAIELWPLLSNMDRLSVFSDIRAEWREDKDRVIADANDLMSTNIIRAGLATDLRDLLAFEKLRAAKIQN